MPASQPIEVVFFDLDDTLFAHRRAVGLGIIEHLRLIGGPFGTLDAAASVRLWNELEEHHYHRYLGGQLDFAGQRRERARDFAARHDVTLGDEAASVWFDEYFAHYVAAWSLHHDALPALNALEAAIPGVRFGIITNGDPVFQHAKLDAIGLTDRMEHVIASGSVGVTKPDARIFEHACQVFGVPAAHAVYVGDRLSTDAIGAARASLTGVWLNRTAVAPSADELIESRQAGVHEIAGLDELPALLTALIA